jgi:UDP-N-acetylmuramoyl-L-alanyl-D-glutamate--2,6-diaminopimelate ligase
MILSQLIKPLVLKYAMDSHGPDPEIASIHYRAQDVKPGGLFVAIAGFSADGHDFIDQALERGAVALVTTKPVACPGAVVIEVKNSRKALAELASAFYGHPSETLFIAAITGTNGKTTTAYLMEGLFTAAGLSTGVIGTINYHYGGKSYPNPVTTPESLDIQTILAQMRDHGVTHVVMEVSSHAIDLDRIHNCLFDVGVFTNLTQDHLDYHKTMQSYWACKKRLFCEHLTRGSKKNRASAVINMEDPHGKALLEEISIPAISYGHNRTSMIWPRAFASDPTGISGDIETPRGTISFRSQLVGRHNLDNIIAAVGVGIRAGLEPETIENGIGMVSLVPGRLERVDNHKDRFVFVDYAHTPDALENVLKTLGAIATGKIISVFGCGGDRDPLKRPVMGEIAGKNSSISIITSDNPRTESPEKIITQIETGIRKATKQQHNPAELVRGGHETGYTIEPDRRKAIELAIMISIPGDTILIAGKGHETYQILGRQIIDFDDRKEARTALSKIQQP